MEWEGIHKINMKIIIDINEANALLQSYNGAEVKIAFFSESLNRIAIRIQLPTVNEVIYLIGIGCNSINGRFRFLNTQLLITEDINNESNEKETVIKDKAAGFELVTSGGFSMAQGMESEFGSSFKEFIKD